MFIQSILQFINLLPYSNVEKQCLKVLIFLKEYFAQNDFRFTWDDLNIVRIREITEEKVPLRITPKDGDVLMDVWRVIGYLVDLRYLETLDGQSYNKFLITVEGIKKVEELLSINLALISLIKFIGILGGFSYACTMMLELFQKIVSYVN